MDYKTLGSLHWINPVTHEKEPLSAGSGLVATTRSLWVVADDLNHLVQFDRNDLLNGKGFAIFSGELPEDHKARKRAKPDMECLFRIPSYRESISMLAFPSGSKPQRNKASEIWIGDADKFIGSAQRNISDFTEFLDKRIPDLNIEGGVVHGQEVTLLQRGNGKSGFNGVISFDVGDLQSILQSKFDRSIFNPKISQVSLPTISGVPLTFTDACAYDGAIYFSAAAESGLSTYEDGEVIGSVVGRLKPDLEFLVEVNKVKIEGLTAAEDTHQLAFFAVTDADDPSKPSQLFELTSVRKN